MAYKREEAERLSEADAARLREQLASDASKVGRKDLQRILDGGDGKAEKATHSKIAWIIQMGKQVKLLYLMLRDSLKGEFDCPWITLATLGAAILYFLSPIDFIPDFIPVIGYLDDVAVLGAAIQFCQIDLKRYLAWKGLRREEYGL